MYEMKWGGWEDLRRMSKKRGGRWWVSCLIPWIILILKVPCSRLHSSGFLCLQLVEFELASYSLAGWKFSWTPQGIFSISNSKVCPRNPEVVKALIWAIHFPFCFLLTPTSLSPFFLLHKYLWNTNHVLGISPDTERNEWKCIVFLYHILKGYI